MPSRAMPSWSAVQQTMAFSFSKGLGCLWICRAVVVLEGALHFLLLGVSQPVYKKSSKGKALKRTSYSCVPFQLLTAFLFLCVPCRFTSLCSPYMPRHSASFFELPFFFCHIWAGELQCKFPALLLLSQEVPLPAQPMDLGQAARFPVLWIYRLEICFENSLVFCWVFFKL